MVIMLPHLKYKFHNPEEYLVTIVVSSHLRLPFRPQMIKNYYFSSILVLLPEGQNSFHFFFFKDYIFK